MKLKLLIIVYVPYFWLTMTKYEVIVVDDGSSDQTQELENIVDGIKVFHNKSPLRFIGACNLGVSKASGDFIVLLNNDTEVTYGWLDELVEGFTNFENVGAVGSRLLYLMVLFKMQEALFMVMDSLQIMEINKILGTLNLGMPGRLITFQALR